MGDEAQAPTESQEAPPAPAPAETTPAPVADAPKGITADELAATDAMLSLMLTGAWQNFEQKVVEETSKATDDAAKRELKLRHGEAKLEYEKQQRTFREYMDTLRAVATESGAPIEILSMAPDATAVKRAGELWKREHPMPQPKKETAPPKDEKTSESPLKVAAEKKVDSGQPGTGASADWRSLSPSEKIKLGLSRNRK